MLGYIAKTHSVHHGAFDPLNTNQCHRRVCLSQLYSATIYCSCTVVQCQGSSSRNVCTVLYCSNAWKRHRSAGVHSRVQSTVGVQLFFPHHLTFRARERSVTLPCESGWISMGHEYGCPQPIQEGVAHTIERPQSGASREDGEKWLMRRNYPEIVAFRVRVSWCCILVGMHLKFDSVWVHDPGYCRKLMLGPKATIGTSCVFGAGPNVFQTLPR